MNERTVFLKDMTPVLDPGDRMLLVTVHDPITPPQVEILFRNNSEKINGLYTGGITECVVVGVIDRDEQLKIDKMSMLHFPGGINQDRLVHFLSNLPNFSGRRELIFYPGATYENMESNTATIAEFQALMNLARSEFQFRVIHYQPASFSCCITFDGQVGGFAYDSRRCTLPARESKEFVVQSLSLEEAEREFDKLIADFITEKKTQKANDLTSLKRVILSDTNSTSEIKSDFLEKTRKFIIKANYFSGVDKQALYNDYVKQIKKIPLLSPPTKKLCVVLAATIVGVVPAIFIAGYSYFSARNRRNEKLKQVQALSNTESLAVRH